MKKKLPFIMLLLTLSGSALYAGGWKDNFFDVEGDGWLDATGFLQSKAGFMPVPIIITEPALGYGVGAALIFFHDSIGSKMEEADQGLTTRLNQPSLSGAVGFYTENESYGAGGFHSGVFKDDTIRYVAAGFYGSLNLKYFADNNSGTSKAIEYNLEAPLLYQELKFRLGESDVFIGPEYLIASIETNIKASDLVPGLPPENLKGRDASLGLSLEYDATDNPFTPNWGYEIESGLRFHSEAFGGDFSYANWNLEMTRYTPLHKKLILGIRLEGDFTAGDVPFFALPFIQMRGVQAMRYQDNHVMVAELEARWDVHPRWSLVGFGGAGWVADELSAFTDAETHPAGGVGFRYLVAKGFRLRSGLDVAWSEEDTAIYITVGNAW